MVCARAYLIASSMTLLTCNLFLFSWVRSLQKKGRSCGHETGVPPRRRRRIIQNHKTRKKKCKKNTQTDDEKDVQKSNCEKGKNKREKNRQIDVREQLDFAKKRKNAKIEWKHSRPKKSRSTRPRKSPRQETIFTI